MTRRPVTIACVLAALATAPPAAASPTQESIFMDDSEIVSAPPERLDATLAQLKSLGVDRVRVSVLWKLIAPSPESKQRPAFRGGASPANPAAYEPEAWDRYDRIVTAAERHGLGLLFTVTAPAPLWATGVPPDADLEKNYDPNPADFHDFVAAVATRYSGTYREEVPPPPPPQRDLLGRPLPQPPQPEGDLIPRVDHWSLWNEPNHPGWLTPQSVPAPGRTKGRKNHTPASPRIYRALVDAGYAALRETGHGGDLILLGETASRGLPDQGVRRGIRPVDFIRELYCLDPRLRPYSGSRAAGRGCPVSREERAAFPAAHPGLFEMSGWAHHPYGFGGSPGQRDPEKGHVTMGDLKRLTGLLDAALRAWGRPRALPIHITEYGYQTDPPDPTIGIPLRRQALYLGEGEWIAFRNPRVASMAQFLLRDDGPLLKHPPSDPRYWGKFQSGLLFNDGRPKPALAAYQRPAHVHPRRQRKRRMVRLFGGIRNAPDGAAMPVRVEFTRRGASAAQVVSRATATNPRGYFQTRLRAVRSGSYRLVWTDPATGARTASAAVPLTVKARRAKKGRRRSGR